MRWNPLPHPALRAGGAWIRCPGGRPAWGNGLVGNCVPVEEGAKIISPARNLPRSGRGDEGPASFRPEPQGEDPLQALVRPTAGSQNAVASSACSHENKFRKSELAYRTQPFFMDQGEIAFMCDFVANRERGRGVVRSSRLNPRPQREFLGLPSKPRRCRLRAAAGWSSKAGVAWQRAASRPTHPSRLLAANGSPGNLLSQSWGPIVSPGCGSSCGITCVSLTNPAEDADSSSAPSGDSGRAPPETTRHLTNLLLNRRVAPTLVFDTTSACAAHPPSGLAAIRSQKFGRR